MTQQSSATRPATAVLPPAPGRPEGPSAEAGLGWGLLGVLAFSFTVPLTRVALDGLSPLFIGSARAVVAAMLAGLCLALTRQRAPRGAQWWRLLLVAGGVVLGFPLLTSYALVSTPATHGAVVIAVLPAATAVITVLRTRERQPVAFWVAAAAGALAAVGFASAQGGGLGQVHAADAMLLVGVVAAAVGYAEGGLLARELGAWQTVSWALVLAAPVMLTLATASVLEEAPRASAVEWASFAYLACISMYLGFFAWYRGLAIGPMARVSQVQLVQPVLSIAWAALLLGEPLGWSSVLGGLLVIACAGGAVRVRAAQSGRGLPVGVLGSRAWTSRR